MHSYLFTLFYCRSTSSTLYEFCFHLPKFRYPCPPSFLFVSPCFPVISRDCEVPGGYQQSHRLLHWAVHEMNWLAVKALLQSRCRIVSLAPAEGSLSPCLFSTAARAWLVNTGELCLSPSHILAPLLPLAADPRWLLRAVLMCCTTLWPRLGRGHNSSIPFY